LIQTLTSQETCKKMQQNLWKKTKNEIRQKKCIKTIKKRRVRDDVVANVCTHCWHLHTQASTKRREESGSVLRCRAFPINKKWRCKIFHWKVRSNKTEDTLCCIVELTQIKKHCLNEQEMETLH
jgi:hypothetical protein